MAATDKTINQNSQAAATTGEPKSTAITVQEKTIADSILARVNELERDGGLALPANYSAANALKSAWLILQNTLDKEKRPVLETCSKASIANSLLDMVIQGLSPVKKQCYFIAYGGQLTLSRSYQGTVVATKRLKGIENVFANIIYEDDVFEYIINLNTGFKEITKHEQKFENIDPAKIKGAYAIITRKDAAPYVEIMNIKQIRASWAQGAAKGDSGAHKNFSDEMAKKTVINRACKSFLNTSDDSDVLIEAINNTRDIDDLPETPYVEESAQAEIQENANKEIIDIKPKAEAPKQAHSSQLKPQVQTPAEPSLEGPGF